MIHQTNSLKLLGSREKTISYLKKTRDNIFKIKNPHFNWNQIYSISFLRKYQEIQSKININELELQLIVDNFKKWVSIPTYLTFQNEVTGDLKFALASKRGNKIYEYYIHRKLNENLEFMNNPNFHKLILRDKKGFRDKKVSNVCFITLTCNPGKYNNSRTEAWLGFEHNYNIFITRFRKKYGKCWIMKAVESTKKGYPHIHLLIITEKEFDVFARKNQLGYLEYRLNDKKDIESYWNSYFDVVIPSPYKLQKDKTLGFMKDYIFKDMLKSYKYNPKRNYKNCLSLAMGWLFGKRVYSVSRMNLTLDLITTTSITQTQKEDFKKKKGNKNYSFLGLIDFKKFKNRPPPISFKITKDNKIYEDCINGVYGNRKEIINIRPEIKTKTKNLNFFIEENKKLIELENKFEQENKKINPKLNVEIREFKDPLTKEDNKTKRISRWLDLALNINKIKLNQSEKFDLAIKGKC